MLGLFGVVRDITEHMEAGQALRDSEDKQRESQRIAGVGPLPWGTSQVEIGRVRIFSTNFSESTRIISELLRAGLP